jgi:hypothetical protein
MDCTLIPWAAGWARCIPAQQPQWPPPWQHIVDSADQPTTTKGLFCRPGKDTCHYNFQVEPASTQRHRYRVSPIRDTNRRDPVAAPRVETDAATEEIWGGRTRIRPQGSCCSAWSRGRFQCRFRWLLCETPTGLILAVTRRFRRL